MKNISKKIISIFIYKNLIAKEEKEIQVYTEKTSRNLFIVLICFSFILLLTK